jgi:hypothetical protein
MPSWSLADSQIWSEMGRGGMPPIGLNPDGCNILPTYVAANQGVA